MTNRPHFHHQLTFVALAALASACGDGESPNTSGGAFGGAAAAGGFQPGVQPGAAGVQPGAAGVQPGAAGVQPGASQPFFIVSGEGNAPGSSLAAGEACASEVHAAVPDTVIFAVLLDQSGSMTEHDDRWSPVSDAVRKFVNDPGSADLGTMLQYFPVGDDQQKCDVATYEVPSVNFGKLPMNASLIGDSLTAHHFTQAEAHDPVHRNTPTRPAVEGTVRALQQQLDNNPNSRGFVLLATDGRPSGCNDNNVGDVADAIEQAARDGINTFVIGIGDVDNLEDMATAGATGAPPFIVDGTGQNTEAEFLKALTSIQNAAVPCDFSVPEPDGGGVADLSKVNVSLTPVQTSAPVDLAQVRGAQQCDPAVPTWHYSEAGGETRIVLCPAVCEQIQNGTGASVSVATGCQTRTLSVR